MATFNPTTELRETFDAASAALLVIDLQNYCSNPAGGLHKDSVYQGTEDDKSYFWKQLNHTVVPNVRQIQNCCRDSGIEVIFTVIESLTSDGRDRSLDYKISGFNIPKGSWDAKVIEPLAPVGDEMVIPKTSSSVFVSTNLDYTLRNLGVKHLIITGGLTDQCVESAVRDACDLGYLVTVVSDACITYSSQRHTSSLTAIQGYCRQRTTAALVEEIGCCRPSRPLQLPKDVKFLRVNWCDSAGLRRCRVIPAYNVNNTGVGLTMAVMALPGFADICAPNSGLGPAGEVRLVPDMTTLKVLPWNPSHASVRGDMKTQQGLDPWEFCPRDCLRRQLAALAQETGLEMMCGFESEFQLMHAPKEGSTEAPPFVDNQLYASADAYESQAPFLDDLVDALHKMNIKVDQIHTESAPGQFELVTRYLPAMEAADTLLLTRDIIHAVAGKHNMRACFLPKTSMMAAGNGGHMHMSLWKDGVNVLQSDRPSESQSFMAGVLNQLPAIMCYTAPSPNSFRRIQPSCWSGAFKCWGWENRECPIRATQADSAGRPSNYELKTSDATANPYLAIAAVAAAGLAGIKAGSSLPAPVSGDPALLPEGEQPPKLPSSPKEALEAARADCAKGLRTGGGTRTL